MRVAVVIFIPFLLYAQNLKELVELSFEHESIKSSQLRVKASTLSRDYVSTSHYPEINVGSSYTTLKTESMGNPKASSMMYAKASMNLYDGGNQRSRENQKESLLRADQNTLRDRKNYIALSVVKDYFNILTLQESKKANEKKLEHLKAQIERLEKFYDAGLVFVDEVEKIKAAYESSRSDLASLELQEQELQLDLNWLSMKEVQVNLGATIKDVTSVDTHVRSDIEALKEQSDAEFENINIQKSVTMPQVNIENTYSKNSYDYDSILNDMKMPDVQNKATVSLNWKIFDFNTNSQKVEVARLNYEISKLDFSSKERVASLELKNAKKAIEIAKVKVEATKARVISADKTFEIVDKKYQNNLVDNVQYLDALTDKYDALALRVSAQNSLEIKKAEFYYYAGVDIKEMIK